MVLILRGVFSFECPVLFSFPSPEALHFCIFFFCSALNLLFKIFTLFYTLYFYTAPLMRNFSERFVGITFSSTHMHFAKMF